ncbi:hypothetical protein OG784_39675 [Streptomyces sp. NBC_01617]|uniref:hypothetical protein n=1 Tax=Streptomyces sp. NBC_01617 TaxID=2975899 RepID=UPI00386753A1|nr:hypothetical protein OG784_39675 [Streptomyces sp. NBC_01617]
MRMMHPGTNAPQRPIDLLVLVSALGPKGLAVTHEIADVLFSVNGETAHAREFTWAALGIHGTVLGEDEPLDSPRIRAAAGPGNALACHAAYEFGGDPTALPGGQAWLDAITAHPRTQRHLAVHDQHLLDLNVADTAAWNAGSWQAITSTTVTGTLTVSATSSASTRETASRKSSTSPPAPTSPANSNASSPSPVTYR